TAPTAAERVRTIGADTCLSHLAAYRASKTAKSVRWLAACLQAGTSWLQTEKETPRSYAPLTRTASPRIVTAPKPPDTAPGGRDAAMAAWRRLRNGIGFGEGCRT
ncbi:MAG: hypothetical protein H7Y38_14500, partial [Armatimonadetes bacterium]|nr:hypothetical protein [Armatimonadota bacterium]